MPIATLTNIEKHFGQRVLFEGLNFMIDRGERVGLIGDNGTGKTTLFKIITGEVQPESGTVAVAKSVKLGYLEQDPTFDPANTVMDEAELAFAELHAISHRLRELEHAMADQTGEALENTLRQYQTAQHDFDLAGGYAWRHRLEATLHGIGLEESAWEQNVETLSGGQRSRLALAKLLISPLDLLLLDEPTNHLDLAAIEWLEKYLLNFDGAVLLISHDRYLLDRLSTRIVWLTRRQLSNYPGNYSAFVKQRDVQELSQQRAYEQQQADVEKQSEFVRRFKAGQRARQAKGREKRLNRLLTSDRMVAAVQTSRKIKLSMDSDRRAGDQVLRARGLSKAFPGKPLWVDVSIDLTRGERVGVIGPNGSGKTTLLRVLIGEADADAGDVRWGANLNIGYYDQRLDDFDPENTVLEETRGERSDLKDQVLRDMLAALLFRGEDVHKQMGMLSGGERARVALAQLLLDRPNVLLLDEPTNHLDIASREALENALEGFAGTILCVSHDRYFLDKTVKRLLVLQPPDVTSFGGSYSAWVSKLGEDQANRAATNATNRAEAKTRASEPAAKPASKDRDNPYKRPFGRLSLPELEAQITQTEVDLAECQQRFADADQFKDATGGRKLHDEYESLSAKLQALEAEYFARGQ
jgi:ATP-binding cassette subfamily F protein 3